MSAVQEPTQASLDGMPSQPAPPPPEGAPRLAVCGELVHQALVRTPSDGSVRIEVLIQQQLEHHPHAVPLVAMLRLPDLGCFDETERAARAKAERLRAGAEVVALGRGVETGRYEGQQVLRLIHCDGIDLAHAIAQSGDRDAH